MDDARIWFVHSAEGSRGPYTASEIRDFLARGILNDQSHLWSEGMSEWARLADIPLFSVPSAPIAPPPPPAQSDPMPPSGPISRSSSPPPGFLRHAASPPSEDVTAGPAGSDCPFSARQLRIGLAAIAFAALVVIVGAVPRPWWRTPGLAFAVFGVVPDPPGDADPATTNDGDDRNPPAE